VRDFLAGHPSFLLARYHVESIDRAERCRDLAEEYHAIAALCVLSTEMRNHYSRISKHYSTLAEAEELRTLAYDH
jgi:hypothetical protein